MKIGFVAPRLITLLALSGFLVACGSNGDDPEGDSPGEVLQSSVERDLSPEVDEGTRAQLGDENRDFAFDMLHQIAESGEDNIFFSPHSISIALAMTYAGASGGTHEELGNTLRFGLDEDQLHPAFNALDLELATRGDVDVENGDPPQLNVVNATWGQQGFPFSEDYLDTLALNYGAGLRAVDFVDDHDAVRERINAWVEDQTEDRIKDLLPPGSIEPSTVLVLTNAIYFLAGWEKEFSESATTDKPFARLDGTEVDAPLMEQEDSFPHFIDDDTHAISLPYVGGDMSFIALKPADADGFDEWESELDRERFDEIVGGLTNGEGTVGLPSFRFEGDYDLKALFEEMGWTNFVELARMLEDESGGLEITDILHKSFIDLDEEGTEAAAATAVVVGETSAPPPLEGFEMHFDRTFYYAIYDHPTDTILFLGRVDDPTAEEE